MAGIGDRLRPLVAAAIEQLVEPLSEAIAEQLGELVPELVRERLVAAVDTLTSGRDLKPAKPATPTPRPRKASAPIKRPARRTKSDGPKAPACSKCGQSGHNARTCGKRESKPTSDDSEDSSPATPAASADVATPVSPDRIARIDVRLESIRERARSRVPVVADQRSVRRPTWEQVKARREELERRALDNPCRDPKCGIERLHVAHGAA